MSTSILIENLSKVYMLGELGSGSLRNDINGLIAKIQGKENPNVIIGEKTQRGFVYSLKNISLEIERGSAVGIIGKNGAGKSTLLKILSQITLPSSGNVKIKGKIASLLEVGTGFHPELSGRDNIFLNGAILGMKKDEIKRKLDEIIAFSGVETYIDTPVKRYSSGMYVRLAFAVAAHLESDILIVDEVLAVGDYSFQKKCLGKMSEIADEQGRTVLFVSHNMGAIEQLCNHGLYLKDGQLETYSSNLADVVRTYLLAGQDLPSSEWVSATETKLSAYFNPIRFFVSLNQEFTPQKERFLNSETIMFVVDFELDQLDESLEICIWIMNENGQVVFNTTNTDVPPHEWPTYSKGMNRTYFSIPPRFLNEGDYTAFVSSSLTMKEWILKPEDSSIVVHFSIRGGLSDSPTWLAKRQGIVAPIFRWFS